MDFNAYLKVKANPVFIDTLLTWLRVRKARGLETATIHLYDGNESWFHASFHVDELTELATAVANTLGVVESR